MTYMVIYNGQDREYRDCFMANSYEEAEAKAKVIACGTYYILKTIYTF